MSTRNVSVLIGPNISSNVKLWAFFIAIIKQTGVSGTWVFAPSGAPHGDTFVRTGLRAVEILEPVFYDTKTCCSIHNVVVEFEDKTAPGEALALLCNKSEAVYPSETTLSMVLFLTDIYSYS